VWTVRLIALGLLGLHLGLVTWFTLQPRAVPWVYDTNLRPFASVHRELAQDPSVAAQSIGADVLRLSPLGVLFPLISARLTTSALGSLVHSVAAGTLCSVVLEVTQASIPGHAFDLDDILLNAAGVALAHLVIVPPARTILRRCRRRHLLAAGAGTESRSDPIGAPRPV
jgi:glycopeptide antibiotics resistance protein